MGRSHLFLLQRRTTSTSWHVDAIPTSTQGRMTYLQYKHRLEFDCQQIAELYEFAKDLGLKFFASVWDKDSCDLMANFTRVAKIPSALITDLQLCRYAREKFDLLIISTGKRTRSICSKSSVSTEHRLLRGRVPPNRRSILSLIRWQSGNHRKE